MEYQVKIIRSGRRTISMSVTADLSVLIRAPRFLPNCEIETFVQKHHAWIEEHLLMQKQRNAKAPSFTQRQIEDLKKKAEKFVGENLDGYAQKMGTEPAGVKITYAVTRWGSCSWKNRLCFSYRIALLPPEAAVYILVHELAHIRVKNHGPKFYAEVEKILPDYRRRIALIRQTQKDLGL